MTAALFQLAFLAAVPFWALMILAPAWRWTQRIIASPWIVLPVLAVWAGAIAPILGDFATEMLNPDLDGVRALLASADGTTAAWAQVIAWDLFIGRWVYLDSRARRVHPLAMAPVLVLMILLSPIGLPVYFVLREVLRRDANSRDANSRDTNSRDTQSPDAQSRDAQSPDAGVTA